MCEQKAMTQNLIEALIETYILVPLYARSREPLNPKKHCYSLNYMCVCCKIYQALQRKWQVSP